jgi:hypothetical protein
MHEFVVVKAEDDYLEVKRGEWRAHAYMHDDDWVIHIFGPFIDDGFIDSISLDGIEELKRFIENLQERAEATMKKEEKIPEDVQKRADELAQKLIESTNDPEKRAKAEEFHKKVSRISPEDAMRIIGT